MRRILSDAARQVTMLGLLDMAVFDCVHHTAAKVNVNIQ